MGVVYLNGEWLDVQNAKISILDQGVLRGDGLFETLRAYEGKLPFIKGHLERFYGGAKLALINMPLSQDKLSAVLHELIQRNHLTNARLRLVVTRGTADSMDPAESPKQPTIFAIAEPLPGFLTPEFYAQGVKVVTVQMAIHNRLFPHSVKSTSYFHNMMAKRHAKNQGAFEAILVDESGHCSEGSTSNLWWARNGKVFTTPLSSGALPGVTRAFLQPILAKHQLAVHEENLSVADLYDVDEAWISGSVTGIVGITHVDGRKISEKSGPLALRIADLFRTAVKAL